MKRSVGFFDLVKVRGHEKNEKSTREFKEKDTVEEKEYKVSLQI